MPLIAELGGTARRSAPRRPSGRFRAQLVGAARGRARSKAAGKGGAHADRSRLADDAALRAAAGGRDRRRRGPHQRCEPERLVPVPRPLRLFRQRQRRHRLGHRRGGRRAAGAARAPGRRDPRRRQRDVQHPGAVERCQPEAAGDLRDLQQRRLPHHQAAPEGVPRRRALHRHGFSRPDDRRRGPGPIVRRALASDRGRRRVRCAVHRGARRAPSPCCWTWWSTAPCEAVSPASHAERTSAPSGSGWGPPGRGRRSRRRPSPGTAPRAGPRPIAPAPSA